MINNKKFTERLQKIMAENEITASAFAEKIDVGRSSISHLISGRNKPSLEIILKILDEFPEVGFEWLVKGKGNYAPSNSTEKKTESNLAPLRENKKTDSPPSPPIKKSKESGKPEIIKIVFFYSDGSFELFQN